MKFEETFDFDYHADTVLRMFSDADFYRKKYEKLGGKVPEIVDSKKNGSQFSITVRHALEASQMGLPEVIRKRMGEQMMLRQTDTWQLGEATGWIDIEIEKAPVSVRIDTRFADHEDGAARLHLAFDIDARVPLLGSKIEKAIAGPITKRLRKDLEVSNSLAGDYAR